MVNKKSKKRTKKRSVILSVVVFVAVCYFVVSFISLQSALRQRKQDLAVLNSQIAAQEYENNELRRLMEQGDDTELIERIAREDLGYAYPNERIYSQSPAIDDE